MNYIKNFKLFESSQKYGIHDWLEDLKSWEWNSPKWSQSQSVNPTTIKKWSDHFIGEGWFDKIENLVDRMLQALKKVDFEEIHLRMYDVYDQVPSGKDKYVIPCIAYGDVDRYYEPNKRKYNGLLSVKDLSERDRIRVIIHIIKEIVYPTLSIGGYPNYFLRQSDESYYVTEPKWQCQNFNIKDYEEMGIKAGAKFKGDESTRDITIHQSDISKKEKYSIDKILEMYKPCVDIEIGGYSDSIRTGKMDLNKLESNIDETLESILPTLDYEEVIFDHSRGDRLIKTIEVYDYSIKILLNF